MFQALIFGLQKIQDRKSELIELSDAQRAGFVEEAAYFETQLKWVEVVRTMLAGLRPGLVMLAPLAGVAMASGWSRKIPLGGLLSKTFGIWQIFNKAISFYRGFRAAREAVRARSEDR